MSGKNGILAVVTVIAALLLAAYGGYQYGIRHAQPGVAALPEPSGAANAAGPAERPTPAGVPASATGGLSGAPKSVATADTTSPAAAVKSGFYFVRLSTDTSKEQPEACLQFSSKLSDAPDLHYQDYLQFDPPAKITVEVAGDRLCIGGLSFGQDHKAIIAAGLPAANGQQTHRPENLNISFGDRPPYVGFAGNGFILPRQGTTGIALETVNVDKVKVTVSRIGDRILARSAFARGADGDSYYAEYLKQSDRRELATPSWSGEMLIAALHNQRVTTLLPIAKLINPRRPGAYLVTATDAAAEQSAVSVYHQHSSATQWVIDTDLALTTMQGADGLHVFVRSLDSAKPLSHVRLTLIAANNDVLGTAETNTDGQVHFDAGLTRGQGANAPKMVMAYGSDEDFTALDLGRPAFDLSDRGVGGRPSPGPVEAYTYTDRGVYRPGETVQIVTLLRDNLGKAIEGAPLTLTITRPDGLQVKRLPLDPKPAGGFHLAYALSKTAARGIWAATASIDGGRHAVGRVEFDVEDFVPQKLKVTLSTNAATLRPNQPVTLDLQGRYLYGVAAAGLGAEGELRLLVDDQPFPAAKGYRFGLATEQFEPVRQPIDIGKTDQDGKVQTQIVLPPLPETSQSLMAEVTAGIFEPGGRITKDRVTLPVRLRALSLGLRPRFSGGQVEENSAAAFDVIALDQDGNRMTRQDVRYRFIDEDWSYDWYYSDGTWHYQRVLNERPLADGAVDVTADRPAVLRQLVGWGHYRLEVRDKLSGAATSLRFAAGWGTSEERDTPDTVDVAPARQQLKPGETVKVAIHPPFAGEMQIVVATDRILATRNITVPVTGTTIDVQAKPEWGAGAYVLATLYRPQAAVQRHQPTRAIGLAWIGIDPATRSLGVAIDTPGTVRSLTTISARVSVAGLDPGETAYVTLAAVDEGILQLTRFASPDPVRFHFGKRRLGVSIRDDYARLLDGKTGTVGALRQGGDASGGESLSVAPTRTVALFSGPLAVDPTGKVTVPLALPSFEGQLRLMTVAYSKSRVGRADAKLTVRDPLVAELYLPRFLAPGDQAAATLLLHNVSGDTGHYRLTLRTGGPVKLAHDLPTAIELASGAQQTLTVPITAGDPGVARFDLSAVGPGGLTIHRDWEIQVRTPRFPMTLQQTALQAPGADYQFDPRLLDAFLPGSSTVSVGFASFKGIDVPGLLQSLDRYPFGCSEQLTSRALPLLYYNDVALSAGAKQDYAAPARLQETINRLLERQDAGGSFGLWRVGDGEARPYLGAYVTDFLARAKQLGLSVPDHAMDLAYRSMVSVTRGGGHYDYWTHTLRDEGEGQQIALSGAAYAYYVLARARRREIGELRYFFDRNRSKLQSGLALAQIGGALAMSGDRARAAAAFREAMQRVTQHLRWDYYATSLRDIAGITAIAAETRQDKLLPDLVAMLGKYDGRADRTQTQEKAWMLLAARAMIATAGPLDIAVGNAAAKPMKQPAAFQPGSSEVAQGYRLTNRGRGDVWRTVTIHGTPKLAPKAINAGMTIEKRITGLDGAPVNLAQVRQNDRLLVNLSGAANDRAYHQAILVDMLPAGFEIESVLAPGRTGLADGYRWLDVLNRTKSREARDDRFVAAFDLQVTRRYFDGVNAPPEKGEAFNIAYIVRAVTPGSFSLPAAVVEDMYRPEVMARSDETRVTILPR